MFAIEARTFMTSDTDGPSSAHPTALGQEMFAVLESVGNTSANVLTEIKNVIQTLDLMTAGLTTTSIISVLGFYKSVNERTAVLVDYMKRSLVEAQAAPQPRSKVPWPKVECWMVLWTFCLPNETSRVFRLFSSS
jgi:hypothetical protein